MQKIISASNARTPLVLRPSAAFVLQHLRSDDAPADARGQRQALVNRVVRGKDGNGGADGRRGGSQEGARAGTFGAPSRSPRGALAASPVEQSGHGLIDDADEQRAVDALRNLHAHASSPSNAKPAAKAHAKQAAQQGPKEPAVIAKVMADVYARAEAARMSSKAAATEARNAAYESRRAAKAPRPGGRPPTGGRGGWQKKKQNTPPSSFPGATPVSAYQSLAGRQSGVDLSSLGNLLAGHGAAQPSAAWSTQLPALSQEPARTAVAPRPAIVPMPRTSLQELMSKVVNERRSAPPPAAPATGVPVHSAAHRQVQQEQDDVDLFLM
ncbi:unnamed protein product [Pedinophyceae sp. YPF-701]|nr:unnamed protein product [Pedinophyceae sp. YPF-701]